MIWKSQKRKSKEFAENHKNHGIFTDNYGIILYTTIDMIKVNSNVVAASNNEKNPVTKFEGPAGSEDEYFLGNQLDTDIASAHARAGQSFHDKSFLLACTFLQETQ